MTPAMTGPVAREEVYRQLGRTDVFVFPTFVEGQPFSVIETFAAGVPIVASDIPTVAGMVDDGVQGVLVPVRDSRALADAIESLLADPERRRRMGAAGRRTALARYDRSVFRAHVAELYRELGARRTPR